MVSPRKFERVKESMAFLSSDLPSCFKMVLGYPSVNNKTAVSTYYPEKKAWCLFTQEGPGFEIVSALLNC